MFIKSIFVALLLGSTSIAALAEDYVVEVHGIVCNFCAYGVSKKVSKLPFIDPHRWEKGVKVDIQNQLVYVSVKEDEQLDEKLLFDAIRSGGYDPVKITPLRDMPDTRSPE